MRWRTTPSCATAAAGTPPAHAPLTPPHPPPLTLIPSFLRAIIINLLPLRDTQADPSSSTTGASDAAGQAAGRVTHNDASEQRFRLLKQLPEISVRVRR
jgi:hypothetical protein